jgi:hypothetical protein
MSIPHRNPDNVLYYETSHSSHTCHHGEPLFRGHFEKRQVPWLALTSHPAAVVRDDRGELGPRPGNRS